VRIVDAEEGQSLNRDYRQKDFATNVLTFGYTQEPTVTADLVLCAQVVAKDAKEQGKTLEEHDARLLVHGALHAQGWDRQMPKLDQWWQYPLWRTQQVLLARLECRVKLHKSRTAMKPASPFGRLLRSFWPWQ
jgi:rRNA maturation RNase YbeY